MAALSDYLESGLLHHVFRGQEFPKPENIAVALCSGVPSDASTGISNYANGGTLPEIPSGDGAGNDTGYRRYNLGRPDDTTGGQASGDYAWLYSQPDHDAGSGLIKNRNTIIFNVAQQNWGWVSGIAIVDSGQYGTGNMLMYAELENPRIIYQGDSVKFDLTKLQIKFK